MGNYRYNQQGLWEKLGKDGKGWETMGTSGKTPVDRLHPHCDSETFDDLRPHPHTLPRLNSEIPFRSVLMDFRWTVFGFSVLVYIATEFSSSSSYGK
jgi:hypothetical protein